MSDLNKEQLKQMELAVDFVRQLPVPAGPPQWAVSAVEAAGKAGFSPAAVSWPKRIMNLQHNMHSIRFAVAALVLIAAGLAFWVLLPSNATIATVAWADVFQRVNQTRTVTCTIIVNLPGDQPQGTASAKLLAKGQRSRMEMVDGLTLIRDSSTGANFQLLPSKQAVISYSPPNPEFDFYGSLRQFENAQQKPLGEKTINGRRTLGLEVTRSGLVSRIWIDPASQLPVEVERYRGGKIFATFRDIQFDVPLDDALFDTEVPAGYQVTRFPGIPYSKLQPPPTMQEASEMTLTPLIGIGPLKFGATREQIIAVFGEPEQTRLINANGKELGYPSKGFSLRVYPEEGLSEISVMERFLGGASNPFAGKTDKGIMIGATQAEVEAAYGKATRVENFDGATVLTYGHLQTSFTFGKDRLNTISLTLPLPASTQPAVSRRIPRSKLQPQPTTMEASGMTLTPLVGIGPIRFGATKEQIIAAFGEPDPMSMNRDRLDYPYKGLDFAVISTTGMIYIGVGNPFAGKTDKGIMIGATRAEVEAAYGKATEVSQTGNETSLHYKHLRTDFMFMKDRLYFIRLNRPLPTPKLWSDPATKRAP